MVCVRRHALWVVQNFAAWQHVEGALTMYVVEQILQSVICLDGLHPTGPGSAFLARPVFNTQGESRVIRPHLFDIELKPVRTIGCH
jgi:hypothetical protein